MVYFQTKNPKFWRVLQWKMLVYYMANWSKYFLAIWYILSHLGYFFCFGCTKKNLVSDKKFFRFELFYIQRSLQTFCESEF
jgi:hypothetical protein